MPSTLPDGEPAPADGVLPEQALADVGARGFGVYVHVPFCAVRCGYCDFNTYTARELNGLSQSEYAATASTEVALARQVLGSSAPRVDTVFFGGGTPTLLPTADLIALLRSIDAAFGLADGVEVTTEANPDSVGPRELDELRAAGFTRISFGMQSAVPHVLSVLERTHTSGRAQQAAKEARAAGFEHVSLDLIYGTPGESMADWRTSLDAALAAEPDHVSAYSLIVEPGTRLAARVHRGELPAPDDDDLADKYLVADDVLGAAGLRWYEVSNWARDESARCRHNELYWRGGDWWGVGPGAHSHVGGVRWWNVKHPAAYADRLRSGASPAAARELLSDQERTEERVLLELRLSEGIAIDELPSPPSVNDPVARGLAQVVGDRLVLTREGRLLADAVVRDLLPD